jgi:hypothetical protein
LILFAALLAANVVNSVQAEELAGSWASGCAPIGKGGRHGLITRITIKGEVIEASARMYAKIDCQTPVLDVNYRGVALQTHKNEDSISFQHTVASITLTPLSEAVVAQYNLDDGEVHGCGLKGWAPNVPKSVAGRTCDQFYFALERTTLYDTAWIANSAVQFASLPVIWTNTDADQRADKPLPARYNRHPAKPND